MGQNVPVIEVLLPKERLAIGAGNLSQQDVGGDCEVELDGEAAVVEAARLRLLAMDVLDRRCGLGSSGNGYRQEQRPKNG
jgi:hypothetical protein